MVEFTRNRLSQKEPSKREFIRRAPSVLSDHVFRVAGQDRKGWLSSFIKELAYRDRMEGGYCPHIPVFAWDGTVLKAGSAPMKS